MSVTWADYQRVCRAERHAACRLAVVARRSTDDVEVRYYLAVLLGAMFPHWPWKQWLA